MSKLINPAAKALRDYLADSRARTGKHISNEAFGRQVGVSDAYISMLKHGKNSPGRRLAKRIATATDDLIPAELWEADHVVLEDAET